MKSLNFLLLSFCLVAPSALFESLESHCQAQEKPPATTGPLTPQQAIKHFRLPPDLRIELVAAEPQIESPVAMAFDEHGRLWVVEMRDYPHGPAKGEKPQGRIRILEDKDGDGFFETSTIWADNLLFANGLLLWKDGAIVSMAPKIVHLRDPKGTGKADDQEAVVLYEGFAAQNPQLRVSHPILGLDGWVYCANGLRGGSAHLVADKDMKYPVVNLSGMDFRFDPVNLTRYEAITGPGQYGNTFDAWGNRFVCDNRHHLRHIVMENRYLKRNPYLAAPGLIEDVSILDEGPLSSGGKVYPISKNWTTSTLHEGRFTAACGVFIYHGKLLDRGPQRPQGTSYDGAAFTCEPTGNLVHMEILTPKGATFSAKPFKQGVEFLATPDDWFRPVFLTHGPEGAMYMVDMYRAVIEHPDFMPPELKTRPDLLAGKNKGRIWRIVPKDHVTKTPRPGLGKASIAELVKTLEHEEPWYRTTAQRLLLQKNDKAMIEPLSRLLGTTNSPHAKILAAWLLERQGALERDILFDMTLEPNPRVREHVVRIAEPRLEKDQMMRICGVEFFALMRADPRLRFQVALSLGGFEGAVGSLADIAWKNRADRWSRLAVQSALPKLAKENLWEFMEYVKATDTQESSVLLTIRELAAIAAAFEGPGGYWQDLQDSRNFTGPLELSVFAGLADGMERRGKTLVKSADELKGDLKASYLKRIDAVLSQAGKLARDTKQPAELRLTCLRILAQAPWTTAKEMLVPLVTEEGTVELRIAALRALATQQNKELPRLLMNLWRGAAPSLRREILEAMLRQPDRTLVLLDEIEANRLKASEVDPLRTRQLLNHANVQLRARAKKLLADNLPADRKQVLARYREALTIKGDPERGRAIFKKNCATCHRVAGIGIDVGPDIADSRTKTLEAYLVDILNPNQAIDNNYVNYLVTTKSGKSLTGIILAETASSITLRRAEGQSDVVLRQDIDTIASSGVSLMPEGLEKSISVAEMADLLLFLKNWRYLNGAVPLK